jgi:hypothetical protein
VTVAVTTFLAGLITMGFLVASLFFFRSWRRTGDGLFSIFACAFILFALNQALAALLNLGPEEIGWVYLLRVAGFALIIVGIIWKNTR